MKANYKSLLTKEQLSYNILYALKDVLKDDDDLNKISEKINEALSKLRDIAEDLPEDVRELQNQVRVLEMSNFFKDAQIKQLKEEKAILAKDVLEQIGRQRDEYVLFKDQQWFVDICRRFGVDPKEI